MELSRVREFRGEKMENKVKNGRSLKGRLLMVGACFQDFYFEKMKKKKMLRGSSLCSTVYRELKT